MTTFPIPPNEAERIQLLHALNLLDTAAEPAFDHITHLVAQILRVPIALVSLVDTERQWFKSKVGLDASETPREIAFCAHTIMGSEPMVVTDATQDVRFANNPLVVGTPGIRFYAGVPIMSSGGLALGTLCAIDSIPRTLTADEEGILISLGKLISKEVQLREMVVLARSQMDRSALVIQAAVARFQTVFERAGVGMALVAPDGEWISVNDALCQIVGYNRDELLQRSFREITHVDDLDADLNLLQQLTSNEIDRYELEKRYVGKNGKLVWVNLVVTKQMSPRGELEYFVSIVTDIQARKTAEESLAELRRDLEKRVATRTEDLHAANGSLSSAMAQQLRSDQALRRREAELSMVIENAGDAYVCTDRIGMITEWNRQAEQTFGWTKQEAIGRVLEETIIPPQMRDAHRAGMHRYLYSGISTVLNQRVQLPAMRRDGTTLPVEVRISALPLDGQIVFSAFLHDISERRRVEDELRLAASVFENSTDGFLVTDANGIVISVNPAFTELSGYSQEEILGHKPSLMRSDRHPAEFYKAMWSAILDEGGWQGEVWNRKKGGEAYLTWATIDRINDAKGNAVRYAAIYRDITEVRSKDESIRHLAFHDALTGLPNRALLRERLEHAIERARREHEGLAVMFMDLDRFKAVNDELGHGAGDLLLQLVAQRVKDHLRSSDTLARLGGDEFVVLLENASNVDVCTRLAGEFIAAVSEPFNLNGHFVQIGASIGISVFPTDGVDVEGLLKRADQAMYAAKSGGRNTFRFYKADAPVLVSNQL